MFQIESQEYLSALNRQADYVDAKGKIGEKILYLSRADCEGIQPNLEDVLDVVRKAQIEEGYDRIEIPEKSRIHPFQSNFYDAMPAYIPKLMTCGVKWLGCYPNNRSKYRMAQTTGITILNDIRTGAPICIMDAAFETKLRTPACTVNCALTICPNAEAAIIVGLGVQGLAHLEFFIRFLPNLKKIYIYDQSSDIVSRTIADWSGNDRRIQIIADCPLEKMVKDSQLICTATRFNSRAMNIVRAEWMQKGQTYFPLEGFSAIEPTFGYLCDKCIVDSISELSAHEKFRFAPAELPPIYAKTGEILAKHVPSRECDEEIIVVANFGLAGLDMAVAKLLYDMALHTGVGTWLDN